MAKLNRLIAVILMLAMLFSVFPASALAVEETEYTEVTLSLNSNTTLDTSVTGLYKDNIFYVTLPILCDLINAEIEDETSEYVKISTNYGYRLFCLYFNESKVEEYLTSEYSYTVTLPQMQYDENVYVSLIHFLEFLDIDYQIGNKGSHNLIIYKRYNIFDAIGEYIKTSHGNHFEWQEVDISEDTAMNSAILALISSDPNILKMVFNPDGMMQDHMEDALLAVVKNEGSSDGEDGNNSNSLESAYQGMSITKDLLGMIQESYKAENLPNAGALVQLSKKVDNIGLGADFLMAGAAAFESAAKFDYMTESQQSLLSDTIIKHSERAEVLEGAWDITIDAANEIQFRVNDTYQNNLTAARESTMDLIYGLTQGTITNADPYTAAINAVFNGFFFITESLLPEAYEYADAVYQAYNCYVLQFASNEIFVSLHNELSDNNYYIEDVGTQEAYWKQIKQSLVLKLKSTITLRDYLFDGDCIEPEFQLEQTIKNEGNIGLLSRVESCEILCITNIEPSYEHDLSWMKDSTLQIAQVSDAFCDILTKRQNANGYAYIDCYHIPEIILSNERATVLNSQIYNDVYKIISDEVYSSYELYESYDLYGVSYSYGRSKDYLSVVVMFYYGAYEWWEFQVYNMSLRTGKEISTDELLASYGLTKGAFVDSVDNTLDSIYNGADYSKDDLIPYINASGELCAVTLVEFVPGYYYQLCNLSNGSEEDFPWCGEEHSTDSVSINDESDKLSSEQESTVPEQDKPENVTSISEDQLLGEWTVDAEYTMDYSDISMWDIYGSSFSGNGYLMEFKGDGSFRYYIAYHYGNGSYRIENDRIMVNLSEGYPVDGTIELLLTSDGTMRVAMKENGYWVFWVKAE